MRKKFLRQDYLRHSRLGLNRKKKQKWRRPAGRDSKMRLHFKGRPVSPSKGYQRQKSVRGTIKGLLPQVVNNFKELSAIDSKTMIAVLASTLGAKKRKDMIEKAKSLNIKLMNVREAKK